MSETKVTTSNTAALEFLLYFAGAWLFATLFLGASTDSFTGLYPWTGASVAVVVAAVPLAWGAPTNGMRLLRFGTPLFVLFVFALRGVHGTSLLERLQQSVEALHFLFLFGVTFLQCSTDPNRNRDKQRRPATHRSKHNGPLRRSDLLRDPTHAFDRLVGQERAVQSLKEVANVVRAGIRVGKRNAPHAVLLFLGPTGVGKTEAARALAQAVYGREEALIRFDMGQFTDSHQSNRFYGPPPGYVGSDKGGQLTQAILQRPRSVVLLDEVEKAHPQIWDAFLPVFDEGHITDGSTNQKVDMTNTIIVLTSNLLVGVEGVGTMTAAEIKDALRDTGVFRPELIGRINEVLVFEALNNETIAEILRRRIDASLWSLSDQGISMFVDDETIAEMVLQVREAKYGVRQIDDVVRTYLRKAITEQQGKPVAED